MCVLIKHILFFLLSSIIFAGGEEGAHVGGGGGNIHPLFITQDSYIHNIKSITGLDRLHSLGFNGNSASIMIIDSGIVPNHQMRVSKFIDYTKECGESICDTFGHGSLIAQKVQEAAPGASLIIAKILDRNNSSSVKKLNKALDWALKNYKNFNLKIINLSLTGISNFSGFYNNRDKFREKISKLRERGVLIVSASGNSQTRRQVSFPGNLPEVISVGSYNLDTKNHSEFSNRGGNTLPVTTHKRGLFGSHTQREFISYVEKPDILAPGEKLLVKPIEGTIISKIFAQMRIKNQTKYMGYELNKNWYVSGTSYSAAIVTGALACFIQKNNGSVEMALEELKNYSTTDKIFNFH